MMKKILLSLTLVVALLFASAPATYAVTPSPIRVSHVANTFGLAKQRTGTVKIWFAPVKWVSSVNYVVSYDTNTTPQGISGSFSPNGNLIVTKDFFLGTCSGSTCIKHQGIHNMKITATFTFIDGATLTKNVKIPVL